MAAVGVLARLLSGASKAGKGVSVMGAPLRMAGSAPGLKQAATQVAKTAAPAAKAASGFKLPQPFRFAGQVLSNPAVQFGAAAASLTPAVMNMPYNMRKGILEAGPDSQGNFRPNIFEQAITGMDGDSFKSAYDQQNLKELLKDPTVRERMSLGVDAPGLGDDIASYMGSTNQAFQDALKSKKREETKQAGIDEFMSPMNQYLRGQQQVNLDREHNLRLREMENAVQIAGDKLDIQRLSLANAQNQNAANMELAKYKMMQDAENDRYRTTAGLIKGLSTLGAAFAL